MAYTLNTGHALYGNLVELIGVQSGALVSLVTGRTFTMQAGATFGSGAFGEHMKTGAANYGSSGAHFTPAVNVNGSAASGHSTFIAVNNIAAGPAIGAGGLVNMHGSATNYALSPGLSGGTAYCVRGYASFGASAAATIIGAGPQSLCATRTQETDNAILHNGVLKATGGALGYNNTDTYDNIGGPDGQGCAGGIEFVWIAWFNKTLSAAETLSLHNSLGAGNAFGLVTAAALDGSAPAKTLTSTSSLVPGAANNGGTVNGSAPAKTLTGTSSVSYGVGTASASGSFTTPEGLENSAGTLWLGQTVYWTWTPAGRVGGMSGKSPVDGVGTTHATTGVLVASGLPAGSGILDVAVRGATAADDKLYRVYGTVV